VNRSRPVFRCAAFLLVAAGIAHAMRGNAGGAGESTHRSAGAAAAAATVPTQTPDAPALLTEDLAVRLALEHDPSLPVLRAEVAAAEARLLDVGRPDDPELRGSMKRDHAGTDDDGGTGEYDGCEITLRLFPPNPLKTRSEHGLRTAELEAARSALQAAGQAVAMAVRTNFLELREREADLEWMDRLVDIRARKHRLMREYSDHGRATAVEVMQAAASWLAATRDRNERSRECDALRRQLAARTGLPEGAAVPRPAPKVDHVQTNGLAGTPGAAPINRPETDVLYWQMRTADAAIREARAERVPWFSHIQVSFGDDDRPGRRDVWSAQAALTLPVFSAALHRDRTALAERSVAEARLAEAREALDVEIREARSALRAVIAAHRHVRESSAPVIREVRRTLDELRAQSDIEQLTLLRLEETLLEAERAVAASRFEVERARLALDAALGTHPFPPPD